MTIEDINNALDSIAQANVEKERDTAKATILKVIRTTSALEQKWFIRVMLKVRPMHFRDRILLCDKGIRDKRERVFNFK